MAFLDRIGAAWSRWLGVSRKAARGPWLAAGFIGASLIVLSCAGEFEGSPNDYPCSFPDGTCNVVAGKANTTSGGAGPGTGGAGPGTGGGGGMLPPDDTCVEPIFATSCAASCHNSPTGLGGSLILKGGGYGAKMAGVPATYKEVTDTSTCKAGALLIDPTNNAESVLLKKLTMMQSCGLGMPIGFALNATDMACITTWVNKF